MPVITIDGPKMTKEQKAELVKEISETASRIVRKHVIYLKSPCSIKY